MTENPDFGDFQVVGWTLGFSEIRSYPNISKRYFDGVLRAQEVEIVEGSGFSGGK